MAQVKRYNPENTAGGYRAKKGPLLYIFLAPLFLSVILALVQRDITAFGLNFAAFGLFYATAKLNTIGLANEFEYHKEKLTKAPAKPYKTISALLLGFSTFFTATIAGGESILMGVFLSVTSTLGYALYYGLDPRTDKLENIGDVSAELVLKTLSEAKSKLSGIEEHMQKILNDSLLHDKLALAVEKAKYIIQTIQEDPKDIRVARKFLVVYIDGLEKVTESYTSIDEADIKGETKEKLHQLLEDVEHRFDKELVRLKKNNEFDLDVNIDVLQQQIKN
jgi:5-bromo-4-chloroindolyl phosphate hydrolysis protein